MAEFSSGSFSQALTYTPTGAVLTITFNDGTTTFTDTITIDPYWAASLAKAIRTNQGFITLENCMPSGTTEVPAGTAKSKKSKGNMAGIDHKNWLIGKP